MPAICVSQPQGPHRPGAYLEITTAMRAVLPAKPQPSAAGAVWRGGARERVRNAHAWAFRTERTLRRRKRQRGKKGVSYALPAPGNRSRHLVEGPRRFP